MQKKEETNSNTSKEESEEKGLTMKIFSNQNFQKSMQF